MSCSRMHRGMYVIVCWWNWTYFSTVTVATQQPYIFRCTSNLVTLRFKAALKHHPAISHMFKNGEYMAKKFLLNGLLQFLCGSGLYVLELNAVWLNWSYFSIALMILNVTLTELKLLLAIKLKLFNRGTKLEFLLTKIRLFDEIEITYN